MSCVNCEIEEHIELERESPMAFPISMANEPKSTTSASSWDSEPGSLGLGGLVAPSEGGFPLVEGFDLDAGFCPSFDLRDRLELLGVEGFGESR